jgi:MFS family permease
MGPVSRSVFHVKQGPSGAFARAPGGRPREPRHTVPGPKGLAEPVELLRLTHFRRLLATRVLSQGADGVFQTALASYVVFSPEREPTPGTIAAAFAAMLLPFCVVGPFAGVLLDRWRRRQVLLYGNLLRVLLCLGTAALVLARVPTPLFFAAALLVTGVNRFVLAGLSAALPRVVPLHRLLTANAMTPTLGTIAATLGGACGIVVRLVLPGGPDADSGLLVFAAAGYGCAALAAATMSRELLGPDRSARNREPLPVVLAATARGLVDGVRHLLRERRPAACALGTVTASRFCYGLLLVTVLMLCRNTFAAPSNQNAGLAWLGLALGLSAAGYLCAAVASPWGARRFGVPAWLVLCLAVAALATPGLGLFFTPVPVLAAAFLLGLLTQGIKIGTDTIVQTTVEDAYRGRVFSVYDVLFNAALVAAAAVAALLLPADGRSASVVVGTGALYAATAVGYRATLRHGSVHHRATGTDGASGDDPSVDRSPLPPAVPPPG